MMKLPKSFLKRAEKLLKKPRQLRLLLQAAFDKSVALPEHIKEDFKTLLRLSKAYISGTYRVLPWSSILKIVGSIIYFVSIIDLVPDFLFGIGLVDDIGVLLWMLKAVQKDLQNFKNWETEKKTNNNLA